MSAVPIALRPPGSGDRSRRGILGRPVASLGLFAVVLMAGLLPVPATELVSVFLPVPGAQVAQAGQYTVSGCDAAPGGAQNAWIPFGDTSPVWHTGQKCPSGGPTGGIFVGHTGGSSPAAPAPGSGAGWVFFAPPGDTITSTTQTASTINMVTADDYELRLYSNAGVLGSCGASSGRACDDGSATFTAPAGSTLLAWGLNCVRSGGCSNPYRRAEMRFTAPIVNISDPVPPGLENGRGQLWSNHTGWLGGKQDLGFTARDNSGIRAVAATRDVRTAGQQTLGAANPACDYSRSRPCPDYDLALPAVDTSGWGDGSHRITLGAVDAGGNYTEYTNPDPVHTDNHAPGQLSGLTVAGGENWRQGNSFDVSWQNPGGQFAPITAARWRFCDSQGKNCLAEQRATGTDITTLSGLQVPRDGDWVLRVWLEDSAGNTDEQTAGAPVHLRFDARAPSVAFEPLDPGDPLAVTVAAFDDVSGVAGGQIQIQQVGRAGSFRALPTTYRDGRLTARLDDLHLRNGDYQLQAIASDVAGNQALTGRRMDGSPATVRLPLRVPIRVIASTRTHTRKVCRAARHARSANRQRRRHHRGRHHSRRRARCVRVRTPVRAGPARVGFGQRKMVYGQVLTASGRVPLAHQPVRVLVALRGQRHFRPGTILVTNASGQFRYRAPAGPARTVRFRYFGTNVLRASHADQVLRVPASSTIRARPRFVLNGGSVRLSGRLRGRHVPRGGVLVVPEVFFRGRWQPFATVRTSAQGRWARRYTFKATTGRVKYPFRVLVPAAANYPYVTGASRAVHVVVQGL